MGGPPWKQRPYGARRHGWKQRPRFLFLRLAALFGFMALLVTGGMAALAFVLTRGFGGDGRAAVVVWLGGCGLALALALLAATVARRAFRRIATPLAEVMAAAEAVAAGDLSARVREYGGGEFGRLGRTFNRMAEELERAEQQRRNLTADVAHELRTPLQIIQGNLEGVLDGVYEPTAGHLEATLDETRLLARLVEDLRTLSLAEAGQLALVWERVDVAELIQDVATSFSGQAEAAGVAIRASAEGEAEAVVVSGDVGRLDQVLSNLVANALRHTPAGGEVTLTARAGGGGVEIAVGDTGRGIAAEDLPYIFDRFWRGDRARSHAGGAGSGLGLAIARQLVQSHGGRIRAESRPGEGTRLTIELPHGG